MSEKRRDNSAERKGMSRASSSTPSRSSSKSLPTRAVPSRASQPEKEQSSGQSQFLFIDASASATSRREAVRVHARREAHRKKRHQSGQLENNPALSQISFFDPGEGSASPSRRSSRSGSVQRSEGTSRVSNNQWEAIMREGISASSEYTLTDLRFLMNEYLQSTRLLQPDILRFCAEDSAALSAYLALAAATYRSSTSSQADVVSANFESKALYSLRQNLAVTGNDPSDSTIIAVLLLSRLEEHKGVQQTLAYHHAGLQRLVHARGGYEAIGEQNPELRKLLCDCGFSEEQA